ncbi:hypothetical protein LACWKB8_1072 [Lactobacillus sp. wkB8]|nr:hypothetical protein LACWKB8_1072 [Lactobacillus sp. wkB8]
MRLQLLFCGMRRIKKIAKYFNLSYFLIKVFNEEKICS